jgi:hypothetical protein
MDGEGRRHTLPRHRGFCTMTAKSARLTDVKLWLRISLGSHECSTSGAVGPGASHGLTRATYARILLSCSRLSQWAFMLAVTVICPRRIPGRGSLQSFKLGSKIEYSENPKYSKYNVIGSGAHLLSNAGCCLLLLRGICRQAVMQASRLLYLTR